MPKAPKIMIIRHAEKPKDGFDGVDVSGAEGGHNLIVPGWERAGALACLFAPKRGPLQDPLLATPEFIFASAAANDPIPGNSNSLRPQQTVMPLAQLLSVKVDLSFSKGDEEALAEKVQKCAGPVLIAWQHENINLIANAILGDETAPQKWPGTRFDLVFVFTLNPAGDSYSFAQVTQCLLPGDLEQTL